MYTRYHSSTEPTPAQTNFLFRLQAERAAPEGWPARFDTSTKRGVSAAIDFLKAQPYKQAAQPTRSEVNATPGYYLRDGTVYHVLPSKRHPERSYAKALTIRQTANGSKRGRWEYAPGIQRTLDGRDILTIEEAARLGHLHGICVVCAAQLTDPASVERGIGPVCARNLGIQTAERAAQDAPEAVEAPKPVETAIEAPRAAQAVYEARSMLSQPAPSLMRSAADYADATRDAIGDGMGRQEELHAFAVDVRLRLLDHTMVYRGQVDTAGDARFAEVLRPAILCSAASLVITHNHPAGSDEPSKGDIHVTRDLASACDLMGIELLDHIIVTETGHTSMRERRVGSEKWGY